MLKTLLTILLIRIASVSSDTATWSYLTNTDIYCGNIGGGGGKTAAQCQSLCLATSGCNAYTLVGSTLTPYYGYCYIKKYTCTGTSGWGYTANFQSAFLGTCQTIYALGLIPASYGYSQCTNSDQSSTVLPTGASRKRSLALRRYALEQEQVKLCPTNYLACPLAGRDGMQSAGSSYECVSDNELNNCGSCGNDCENIPHAQDVRCAKGQCNVAKCEKGYKSTGSRCVPRSAVRATRRRTKAGPRSPYAPAHLSL